MKILLCHNFYQQAGGEDFAVQASKKLLESYGHDVRLFTRHSDEIESYNSWQKLKFLPETVYNPQIYQEVRQLIHELEPDIAHVHNVFPLLSPALYNALSDARVPMVQTIHNYRLMCINSFFLRNGQICEVCKNGNFLPGIIHQCYRDSYLLSTLYAMTMRYHRQRHTFRRINHVIALTEFAATKLIESGCFDAANISVLGNFLSTPLPEAGEPTLKDPYFIFLGRLSSEKGIFTILEAARAFRHVNIKIVGTGPLMAPLQAYITEHNLAHVEMLGYITGEQKYSLLRNALGCIIPSLWYENFPITVLESAAVGTPLIACNIGSLGTLINGKGIGITFTPGESEQLGKILMLLKDDITKTRELGEQAAQWVRQNYTDEIHYKGLLKIYNKVIDENRVCH